MGGLTCQHDPFRGLHIPFHMQGSRMHFVMTAAAQGEEVERRVLVVEPYVPVCVRNSLVVNVVHLFRRFHTAYGARIHHNLGVVA